MDTVVRAGRSVSNGVYRVAGVVARGARRILAAVPLLGIAPVQQNVEEAQKPGPGGEEAETASATAGSPTEEKSAVSSPTAENEAGSVAGSGTTPEAKEETAATTPAASAESSPVEEKKEEPPTPSAPTPLPVEDKKEEVEKVEAEKKAIESTPEPEAPAVVENNVAHENSTTESSDDAPKVAPPAVPVEAPASPPSAPAITEDVASVTKAIEEIDISDKAVAAAAIECTTNEIIADQIDIKE